MLAFMAVSLEITLFVVELLLLLLLILILLLLLLLILLLLLPPSPPPPPPPPISGVYTVATNKPNSESICPSVCLCVCRRVHHVYRELNWILLLNYKSALPCMTLARLVSDWSLLWWLNRLCKLCPVLCWTSNCIMHASVYSETHRICILFVWFVGCPAVLLAALLLTTVLGVKSFS